MRRQHVVDRTFEGLVWLVSSVRGCGRCASLLIAVLLCVAAVSLELPVPGADGARIALAAPARAAVPEAGAARDGMSSQRPAATARASAFDAMPHTVSVDEMHMPYRRADRLSLFGNNILARIARLDPNSVDPQPRPARATGSRASSPPSGEASGDPGAAGSIAGRLTKEQRNIARFISKRYRVELEDTREIVYHAYHAAREFKVDPLLVLAIVSVESSFRAGARSPKGAQGLMQVHTRVHRDKFEPYGGVHAAFDPRVNLRVGTRILREYIERGGDIETGLKFYVGAAFLEHDFGYARKVLAARARIAAAATGSTPESAEARAGLERGRASPTAS